MEASEKQAQQVIRHFRVDTAGKDRITRWPSVSAMIDTGRGVVRVIAREAHQPFNKKQAKQVLMGEFEGLNVREYAYGDRFQSFLDQHDPRHVDDETLMFHLANLVHQHLLDRYRTGTAVESAEQVSKDHWLIDQMYRVKTARSNHRTCDEIEQAFDVAIDRETMTLRFTR